MSEAVVRSKMALVVLMFTSVGGTERDPTVRVDDPVGPRLLRWSDKRYSIGKVSMLHSLFRRGIERSDPGAYGFMLARLLHMDDVVRREAAAGIDQLVILGAGYDTRAYRMSDELAGVQVFEVDLPAMSLDKRTRLKRVLGLIPEDVQYVEVDFNRQDFLQRLAEHGYDDSARTLFVLSGVSMYLPEEAVLGLFSRVATQSSPRTSLLFDYVFDDVLTDPQRYPGAEGWFARAAEAGEEVRYGIAMDDVGAVLESRGLRLSSQSSMVELGDRYLRRADGTCIPTPYGFAAVAHAKPYGETS